MLPPVTYQGGKMRMATEIIRHFNRTGCHRFYDLCCGSGAISLAMVEAGYYRPSDITMVDCGPWGAVWRNVGEGSFDMARLKYLADAVPKKKEHIHDHMVELHSVQPTVTDVPYIFLLLQAAAFGGKAVYMDGARWAPSSFRNVWSRGTRTVNPMMPMPQTIVERMKIVVERMYGVKGLWQYVEYVRPGIGNLAYIDPPYADTTGYGTQLHVEQYVKRLSCRCYVSEARAMSPEAVCLSQGRTKGGISGKRKRPNAEWLSGFNLASA